MKKRIITILLTLSCVAMLFAGCGKKTTDETIEIEPTVSEQDTLDLFEAYLDCNDLTSARALADAKFTEASYFVKAEKRLTKREEKITTYLATMQTALDLFGNPAAHTTRNDAYASIYEFEQSEEFLALLDYVGKNDSFTYVPHTAVAPSYTRFSMETATGISFYTYKGCDCIYWYVGDYTGIYRSHGNWIHVGETTTTAVLDVDFTNAIIVEDAESDEQLSDEETPIVEEQSEADLDAADAQIEEPKTENIMANGEITEYTYTNGILTETKTGMVKSGKFDGTVTIVSYTANGTLTGTATAKEGLFERLNSDISEETAVIDETQFVYAAMYDEEETLKSFKVSETAGVAELSHTTICPDSYQVFATKRNGQVTAFPCVDSSSLSYLVVNYTTASGTAVMFSCTAPTSLTASSGSNNITLVLSSEDERIKLSSWCYSTTITDKEHRLINLAPETVLNWLDAKTTFTEGNLFETTEDKEAQLGRTIIRVTNVSSTGITYEGYMIYIDNYKTKERYYFSYLVERSLFKEENALEVARSISPINK